MSSPLLKPALILPPSVARSREAKEPVNECVSCHAQFPIDQMGTFVRHVRDCSERHQPEMEAKVALSESDYFSKPADPERYAWIREGKT